MPAQIQINTAALRQLCAAEHIRKLSLFGSVLGDDFGPASDVDILLEFESGKTPGLFRLAHIERELSILCGGRHIDVRTPNELSRYFRDEVMATALVQYVA